MSVQEQISRALDLQMYCSNLQNSNPKSLIFFLFPWSSLWGPIGKDRAEKEKLSWGAQILFCNIPYFRLLEMRQQNMFISAIRYRTLPHVLCSDVNGREKYKDRQEYINYSIHLPRLSMASISSWGIYIYLWRKKLQS